MKIKIISVVSLLAFALACVDLNAAGGTQSRIDVGLRQHMAHATLEDVPFGDRDISYCVAYECQEENAYWQIGLGYTPHVTGNGTADYIITPQLNLVATENIWRAGIGALMSYVHDDVGDSDWSDVYWQMLAGVGFPLGTFQVDVLAHYTFDSWDGLRKFGAGDIEYGVWLKYAF